MEIPKHYNPSETEEPIFKLWVDSKAFSASPRPGTKKYVIMMPLPNVTGALHMGHAMDNIMQDLLIRWHRMQGDDTLWMAGTDHAGIATQAIVEKRLFELEGKTRHDIGREALIGRIWQWKDEYQTRILSQLMRMGCSCDWDRTRFTMDPVCSRAVRTTFFNMFSDGIIFRGDRLVNWDCMLQTAVADDEIVYEAKDGHFWYLRYPVISPQPGEPEYVVVATTRPETMMGDTAVACHPSPESALREAEDDILKRIQNAPAREKADLEKELAKIRERRENLLGLLSTLAKMAREGRKILLPLVNREIPLVADHWAKPELGTGCVKITPAHDHNDYGVMTRHPDKIAAVNILNPDGTLNENAGPYRGMERFTARDRVVEDLTKLGLLEAVEDRPLEIGLSDRSKTPVEPYLSRQWFVCMGDVPGGVVFGRGTDKEFVAAGLAQAAMDAVDGEWQSATGKKTVFHPDQTRYSKTYLNWLAEKRDWCISRQLWWGHQIPIWRVSQQSGEASKTLEALQPLLSRDDVCCRVTLASGESRLVKPGVSVDFTGAEEVELLVCLKSGKTDQELVPQLQNLGFAQDPDVLDTWFSSALWPHSTLGWPDPETAQVGQGQGPLDSRKNAQDFVSSYYPGSCLVTARDIITLWVARMILAGLYNLGDVPFTDVFVHANILDGKGQRMSKSKGNGIDPVDIISKYGVDAMRYVLCEMQTGNQDIRLPVQAISPFTGNLIDLATAKRGTTMFTYVCPDTGKEFDVLGTMDNVPPAKLVSERFEVGMHFCTKLWNAARLAFMNLSPYAFTPRGAEDLADEDRWILSRLSRTISGVHRMLEDYDVSGAITAARGFFWSELCDWYLEIIKPRLYNEAQAPAVRQVLAAVMDQVLRLLHPFVPFITEVLWRHLNDLAPERGINAAFPGSGLLVRAAWPRADKSHENPALEESFGLLMEVVRAIRDVRSKYNVPPKQKVSVLVKASGKSAEAVLSHQGRIRELAGVESLQIGPDAAPGADAASAIVLDMEIHVSGVVDLEKEKKRLEKMRAELSAAVERSKKKLGSEGFLAKAKPEIVEKERVSLAENEKQLASILARLKIMG